MSSPGKIEVSGTIVNLEVTSRAGKVHSLQQPVPRQRFKDIQTPDKSAQLAGKANQQNPLG